ncbi:MAG: N-acetyl-gamma-glutamyl-phosphate reductase [Candidatus Latescibacteria bacterium]|jgi:N-acetyl-gamma-glutamyl-phosphate reductase|nr:N-acetyl-gamma-glutamyl-phosphate reductase [Candidatus Latescibacterota bacterium]
MVSAAIIGATGYTGIELFGLVSRHPEVNVAYASSEQYKGQRITEVFPHLNPAHDISLCGSGEIDAKTIDVVFFCTPDGVAMKQAGYFLDHGIRVIDVSPDFRFDSAEVYTNWYKNDHTSPELLAGTVYGIPELNRQKIREAVLIGNPGCYPTSVILGLAPLLEARAVDPKHIIVDAKSGVSGAGRGVKLRNLFVEVNDSITPYNIGHSHRHVGEIEQELTKLAGIQPFVIFSPHLTPMNRGILSTIYVRLNEDLSTDDLHEIYKRKYVDEPFIRLQSCFPETRFVAGTNFCDMKVQRVEGTDQAIVTCAIDNLVKGAAGQAVQNMNVMLGYSETTGLL